MDTYPIAFAAKSIYPEVRSNSRSGGVFTGISDVILNNNGVIYGCKMDQDGVIFHARAVNAEERNLFRGSKYVESDLKNCFRQVVADLSEGRYVLFSGTSCQVAGLLSFLRAKKVNSELLITVDIVCHGVPSSKIWTEYRRYLEDKWDGKIESYEFRNKNKFGWVSNIETVVISGKSHDTNDYTQLFYNHHILRPSCFCCRFKDIPRNSDITLADFWGIDKVLPKFNDGKGVSLVLVNSEKGKHIFESCSEQLYSHKVAFNPWPGSQL